MVSEDNIIRPAFGRPQIVGDGDLWIARVTYEDREPAGVRSSNPLRVSLPEIDDSLPNEKCLQVYVPDGMALSDALTALAVMQTHMEGLWGDGVAINEDLVPF